jgi:hypothetical protein
VEWLLAVLAVLALCTGAMVVAALLIVRAVRRRVSPVVDRAGVALLARAPGASGEVARLRRDLDDAVRRGRRAVSIARSIGGSVGDVPGLLNRIEVAAADVNAELRAVSAVADPARRAALLDGPRRRVAELMAAADDLAEAVAYAAAEPRSDISELRSDCVTEAEALREGARVHQSWGRLAG